MAIHTPSGPLILGASGRLGRAVARVWPVDVPAPVWQVRKASPAATAGKHELLWDILHAPAPDLPAVSGVIVLAGVTAGSADELALNTDLAQAGADLGSRLGVPVIVASTQAVYGPQQGLMREDSPLLPFSDYGRAKVAMEGAVAAPHVTCLRIGNVVGCDALAQAMARFAATGAPVTLDRFANGRGPQRAMLGPDDLVQVMLALLAAEQRPTVLNVARPGLVGMADILTAAGVPFDWRPAGLGALAELALDVSLMQDICVLPQANAAAMVQQGYRV